jgi:GT2 family glycosyltransferase
MPTEPFDVPNPISSDQIAERPTTRSKVSVVIPCCGQLEYTRLCVSSLLRHSRPPYELVFVDLDSMDGTAEFLAGILVAASVPIHVLRLSGNAGFAEALNRGIPLATGDYVVLLNNDTIVTSSWLEHFLGLADSSPTIGLVGAMSNCAAAPQAVSAVPYRLTTKSVLPNTPDTGNVRPKIDTEPMHRFAQQWAEENRGQWFEADALVPFCWMFKRPVLNHVLPLEPSSFFTLNADLVFRRIREAGFHMACCRDLFIHHFGSRPSNPPSVRK